MPAVQVDGHAYIQGGQLDVGVLVSYALLQRAHGVSRLHCLGANHVGYLEVEGHVLAVWHQQPVLQLPLCSVSTYRLDVVARSICSSSALLVDDPNQPAMVSVYARLSCRWQVLRQSSVLCSRSCSCYCSQNGPICTMADRMADRGAAAVSTDAQVAARRPWPTR